MLAEYNLRDATIGDITFLADLHVQTFNDTHGAGPTSAVRRKQWTEILSAHQSSSFCIVLETNNRLIGFVRGIPHQGEPSGFEGELNKIYLLRSYHRRGLGKRLLCAAARRFIDNDIRSMLLFGDAASPTNLFYEAMGGERLHTDSGEFHGGYGWRDLHALVSAACRSGNGL